MKIFAGMGLQCQYWRVVQTSNRVEKKARDHQTGTKEEKLGGRVWAALEESASRQSEIFI